MPLKPPLSTVQALKDVILALVQSTSSSPLSRAGMIATQLETVNQWSSQIALLLEGPDTTANANAVFAIRKELFIAPLFKSCVLGLSLSDLPSEFQDFVTFISKLILVQKPDKPVTKVRFR
jgi:predicted permease